MCRLLHQWGFVSKVATKKFVNSATCKEKLLFKEKNKKYVGTKIRQGFIIIEQDESYVSTSTPKSARIVKTL